MIPKKSNELYREVAEDLEVSEDLVEDLVQLYYKEIRKNLTGLKYPRINVDGLGQFVAKQADWIFDDEAFLCQADDGECTG